ncbi:endo-1,4-beta-xylanase [Botrimarina sp.]|uniref:endo-1,4-beta-xylanase n=1 Tax=Botrimarina sp. TaxID=2795802 RepID=UPI0032EA9B68
MSTRLSRVASWMTMFVGVAGSAAAQQTDSLRRAFSERFDIGTALAARQLVPPDRATLNLVAEQFSVVTPENVMKWSLIHPTPDRYDFVAADALVEFAADNGLKVVGHTLVWHSQCPRWVFQDERGDPISRDALIERMRDHIHTVVGRYRGRVQGWDVVNEAILDDGAWRDTPWRRLIGDDYLDLAFRFAHEADPDTELYYNDFSMTKPGKRRAATGLVERFRRAGVPIHGVGLQGHWGLDYPSEQEIDDALADYSKLGVHVMITELDIDVLPRPDEEQGADVGRGARRTDALDPYRDGLPESVQQTLADRYAACFRLFNRHADAITRVTFWGVDDGQTWHNNWPVPGRTAHSLIFDRQLRPKPAYQAILDTATEPR